MLLHVSVVTILHPFIETPQTQRLQSFSSLDSHPKAVYAASIRQIKHLAFWFCASKLAIVRTAMLNPCLLTLCTAMLTDLQDPLRRQYFLLVLHYWKEMHLCYPVFFDMAKGFLALAIRRKFMSSDDAQRLLQEFGQSAGMSGLSEPEQPTTSVDLRSIMPESTASDVRMHDMALEFDDLVMFEELTFITL